MPVERLSVESLEKIFKNQVNQDALCVVKFYSNGCHFCEALKDEYLDVASQFKDVLFFAFNVDDSPDISHIVKINGVPTISLVRTGTRRRILFLEDPAEPHDTTWYHPGVIASFIKKEKER